MKRPSRKRSWSQPLADLVGAAIHPVLARQGFGQSDVILNWDDIVGERLAANSQPIKLQWPPRPPGRHPDAPPQSATLQIRVESGFALELQHMADVLIDRINAHLGWRCVGRLAFKQGPIDRLARIKSPRGTVTEAQMAAAAPLTVGVADDALRAALTRLGAHVLSRDVASRESATDQP
ncbi:DUF721 domain-containing protein [Beijerinckia sp. L45]|uniref:DUF721 domain-containing protein n=1 Tax=Beijerinckia sp. L45 TaxID=1641855 RepID=UPI001FEFC959|nr:DciA family protein [Beijerinckia sp. L45]